MLGILKKGTLLFSLFVFLCSGLSAEDWPRWRGSMGNSVYKANDWDLSKLSNNALWSASIGEGFSSPSVAKGKLFCLGYRNGKDTISCFDALTGRKIWSFSYNSSTGEHPGPRSTPTIDGNRVYTMSRLGVLYCLNLESGKEIWSQKLADNLNLKLPGWHLASSPIIRGNVLYLNVNRHGAALDKYSGDLIWSSSRDAAGYASPVFYENNGSVIMAMFGKDKIYAVNPENGKEIWSYNWKTGYDVNAADPLIIGDRMFLSTGYNKGAVMLDISGQKPKELWTSRATASHFSSFVEYEGYIYGNSGSAGRSFGSYTQCIDPEDGSIVWKEKKGFGSLILAGNKLVILNENGKLMIAEANPDGYTELANVKVLSGQCWTPPIMANGLLYLRNTEGNLVCYDLRK